MTEDLDGRSCSKGMADHGFLCGVDLSLPGVLFHAIEPANKGSKPSSVSEASFRNGRLGACSDSLENVIRLFDLSKTNLNLRRPKFLVQPLCVVRPNLKWILFWKDEVGNVPVALGLLLPMISVIIGLLYFDCLFLLVDGL